MTDALLRLIMLDVEEGIRKRSYSGYTDEAVLSHKQYLLDSGLAKGNRQRGDDTVKSVILTGLTERGKELLSTLG